MFWPVVGAVVLGCACVLGGVEGGKALLRVREEREVAKELAVEARLKAELGHAADNYIRGAVAGITSVAGPQHPGRVDEMREALKRVGVADGEPLYTGVTLSPDGEALRCFAAVPKMWFGWSDQAESVSLQYEVEVRDAAETKRLSV